MTRIIKQRTILEEDGFDNSIHPVLKRVLQARRVTSNESLDYSLKNLLPFSKLKNINDAVDLLYDAIKQDKRLLIVADFDADGATSCALGVRGLTALGAKHVEYIVPNRFDYGYGLTPEIVELASELEPDIIITVDNGISSINGVNTAKRLGIDVLITDHHLPGQELPAADVILNPNQAGDEYPSKCLAGVGVMFNLLIALRAKLRELNWFEENGLEEPNLACFLDLVALGTVADLVPLDFNNRILVAQGLSRIRKGLCCEGIRALMHVGNRSFKNAQASDLGFAIGPRLNAAGRLTDMSLGIECLLADDDVLAMEMAKELDELNRERRRIQNEMQDQALSDLSQEMENLVDEARYGMCLFNEDWHQGVVGILASKIKEQFHRPVIAFACDKDDMIKGSARSISGVHIRDVLEAIDTQNPDLIHKFGGHAMAAGLNISINQFETFSRLFDQEVRKYVGAEDLQGVIISDGQLEENELSLHMASLLQKAGPWGQGFPEPVFNGEFEVLDKRIVGDCHLKMRLKYNGSAKVIDAIAFNTIDDDWPEQTHAVELAYRLDINRFQGRESVQLMVEYVSPLS